MAPEAESNYERAERLTIETLQKDARITGLAAEVDNLHHAMERRAVIEQAKGIVMRTMGCGAEAAFAVIVAQSQFENRKLYDLAIELVQQQSETSKD